MACLRGRGPNQGLRRGPRSGQSRTAAGGTEEKGKRSASKGGAKELGATLQMALKWAAVVHHVSKGEMSTRDPGT